MKTRLDASKQSAEHLEFEDDLFKRVVGQDDAVRTVAQIYNLYHVGLSNPEKPIANLLFLGPTGTGKTLLAESMAEILVGTPDAMIRINCAEFQHSHEIAKLLGSPPGYLGHRETHPIISNEILQKFHTEKFKVSFVLFDEIEKASDGLWQLLLGIMDKGSLTLGDNSRVDLRRSIIFMTSNLGGKEITDITDFQGIGFEPAVSATSAANVDARIDKTADNAAKRKFTPEFMNRIDRTVVFHPLRHEHLVQILDIELNRVQKRILDSASGRFVFRATERAKEFLLKEGTDVKYGARHLKRALDQNLVYPFANLLSTEQVSTGDVVTVDFNGGELVFYKEAAVTA